MAMNYHRGNPTLHERAIRAANNLMDNSQTGALERALERGEPLIVGLADGTQQKVSVTAIDTYDVTLDGKEYNKRELLYAIPPKSAKNFKKARKRDSAIAELGLRPAYKVRDRVWISKMVLQRFIDEGGKARFTLTDGSIIPVRLRSFGLYEIDGDIRGAAITIFRHGVYRLQEGDNVLVELQTSSS